MSERPKPSKQQVGATTTPDASLRQLPDERVPITPQTIINLRADLQHEIDSKKGVEEQIQAELKRTKVLPPATDIFSLTIIKPIKTVAAPLRRVLPRRQG